MRCMRESLSQPLECAACRVLGEVSAGWRPRAPAPIPRIAEEADA